MNYDSLQLSGKKTLVMGLGDTGLSCARWLHARGAAVSVADSRSNPPNARTLHENYPDIPLHAGPFRDDELQATEMLVLSPGIALSEPAVSRAIAKGVEVVGDVELFARAIAALNRGREHPMKVIAITGSNGKSTTTALVGEMCKTDGMTTVVAGNIGPPVLDALLEVELGDESVPRVWVLELSSFQLETTSSLDADAAAVLNISEDHMDRYADIESYAAAKARIFSGTGVQVLNREDARAMAMALPGRKVVTFGIRSPADKGQFGFCEGELCLDAEQLMPASDMPITGLHNVANALAALALATSIGVSERQALQGLRHFKGLPHRVQWIADIDGVSYFDDSKGTNVGATEAALYGMGRKVVVILGGDGKGQDFSPLKQAVAANARAVILIGRDGPQIGRVLEGCGVAVVSADSLEDAVRAARSFAHRGDAVLLSPACASFDMFRNYLHRAEVFVSTVHGLSGGRD
ncbi:MAG: UDP-N-acetylmuramoyl-L-alanine--D-glutamate ligase [Thiobacillaceae bacterium]|jgi:UDP-N-acetylmuramoylalanine--D-glutamate ligase